MLTGAMLNRSAADVAALLAAGADPTAPDGQGRTAAQLAAQYEDTSFLRMLLEHGVSPDTAHPTTGETLLMAALMTDRRDNVALLLAAGARLDVTDQRKDTALHIAAKVSAPEVVLALLEAGADPEARDARGVTFQRYLRTPASQADRYATVRAWLREHDVPLA
ncbi:MAG: phospholipase [Actinophytocola sp.]|uniref:ankyrin repeat domain-containing protein n=1 Tax=Actinophytocola sp. TaxID=1872138 RepID=UPI00132A7AB9|nr:ankyrin repeat domain-containing protein [Actinophytocola sp.]MPZ85109.1 phospholipase [Actinophytocola sp.]